MMTQLLMAWKLDQPAGVLLGDFTRCDDAGPRDLREIVTELFRHASYPVVMGMRAGHGEENLALPFGERLPLDGTRATLELFESPVRRGLNNFCVSPLSYIPRPIPMKPA